jgi:hypothetical protein
VAEPSRSRRSMRSGYGLCVTLERGRPRTAMARCRRKLVKSARSGPSTRARQNVVHEPAFLKPPNNQAIDADFVPGVRNVGVTRKPMMVVVQPFTEGEDRDHQLVGHAIIELEATVTVADRRAAFLKSKSSRFQKCGTRQIQVLNRVVLKVAPHSLIRLQKRAVLLARGERGGGMSNDTHRRHHGP